MRVRRGALDWALFVASALAFAMPATGKACEAGARCDIEGGYYIAVPPPDWDGEALLPVVVYYHGWNGSPERTLRNRAMLNRVHARGALFVTPYAPTGYWRQIGAGRAEGGRDELAYARALLRDVAARWPIDARRTLASGFSRGASMVWNLACYGDSLFHAYAPIAGGFWHSTPDGCPGGPVRLRHIHGLADRVVAFDEVGIYNSMPIPEGFAMLRGLNGCPLAPDRREEHARYSCSRWTACTSGAELSLCTHPRGHSIRAEWVAEGLEWMLSLER